MTASRVERWLSRPGVVAAVRLLNAVFFVSAALYCFLSYSPFAYAQFIKPNVVPALTEFVVLSHWYFWVVLFATLLTLLPQLRTGRARGVAVGYLVVWSLLGVAGLFTPPLGAVGNTSAALVVGIVSLTPPIWLAVADHLAHPLPPMRSTDTSRALAVCLWSAGVVWAIYAVAVPFRLQHAIGFELGGRALGIGLGSALLLDLGCFLVLFLALAAAIAVARLTPARAAIEYGLFVGILGINVALVTYLLIGVSITFTGWDAALVSVALGLMLGALWTDVALLRSRQSPVISRRSTVVSRQSTVASPEEIDSLALFCAPIAGVGSRGAGLLVLLALPFAAYELAEAVSHFDWNFLLQKLTVLVTWLAAFTAVCAATRRYHVKAVPDTIQSRRAWVRAMIAGLAVVVLYAGLVSVAAHGPDADRYAVVDPSFRLIRDARAARSADTAEYYAFLRSNTFIPPADVPALDVDFAKPLEGIHGKPPDIFLIIVDSLRRDYLAPYNAKVTFTPAIAALAQDSLVFDRAFTRYSGTALAVPSIWAGGMILHALEQPEFGRRNTLLKLLDANRYVRFMDIDHVVGNLIVADANLVPLDVGKTTMQFDVCRTVSELESHLAAADPARPAFFYSLAQNVHISIASSRKIGSGEAYPGFFAPVASSVHRVDACIGGFVDFLRRTNRYDNSIIILTSDHGDSLGEEGRWGHGHFLVPEVMRIPLIVHLPLSLRGRFAVDLSALAFSSDITPSLYALLGYEGAVYGSLLGRSVFASTAADLSSRRGGAFLLASSYGTTYGMLRDNGRRLYVVDAVDGRDSAYDIGDGTAGERVDVTGDLTAENRALIRQQLIELARQNNYRPKT